LDGPKKLIYCAFSFYAENISVYINGVKVTIRWPLKFLITNAREDRNLNSEKHLFIPFCNNRWHFLVDERKSSYLLREVYVTQLKPIGV